jgi:uridine kinase
VTVLIGISGPSSSGKSTVAREIARRFSAELLEQDRYFVDPDDCLPESNFCDPQFLRADEFVTAVCRLSEGLTVEMPEIDFATFRRTGTWTLRPTKTGIAIVEGMTILRYDAVTRRLARAYYLKASVSTILDRKLRRDVSERGKTETQVHSQMLWVSSELAADERSFVAGSLVNSGVEVVDAEDIAAATEAISDDLHLLLETT